MNIITLKPKNALVSASLVLLLLVLFIYTKQITNTVMDTLIFCFNRLIPSIFPFMIFSSIFAQFSLKSISERDNKYILGISKQNLSIILPSWLSGFLVGPYFFYNDKSLDDITNYAFITSNAGIGFVISFVGITLWQNIFFGIYLYIAQIISSIIIFNIVNKHKVNSSYPITKNKPLLTIITDSVNQSTKAMLDICGFTIFFSVLKSSICLVFSISLNSVPNTIISCLLEISNGVLVTSALNITSLSAFFTGFSVGFGGLCIFAQTISICKEKIRPFKFLILKLFHGTICGALSLVFVLIFRLSHNNSINTSLIPNSHIFSLLTTCFFIFFLLNYTKKSIFKQI